MSKPLPLRCLPRPLPASGSKAPAAELGTLSGRSSPLPPPLPLALLPPNARPLPAAAGEPGEAASARGSPRVPGRTGPGRTGPGHQASAGFAGTGPAAGGCAGSTHQPSLGSATYPEKGDAVLDREEAASDAARAGTRRRCQHTLPVRR